MKILLLFCACVCAVTAGKHDMYKSYSVHTVEIRDAYDAQLLHELEANMVVDIWQHGSPGQRHALVMVSPEQAREFLNILDGNGLTHSLHLADVAQALEKHDNDLATYRSSRTNRMVFEDYPRYAEVDDYMERIAATFPNLVTLVNAGPSFEGRAIKYLKISTTNFTDTSKPVYFMDAMIHAREWVTTPVTLYSIFRLLESRRPEDQDLLDDVDWIILPIVNPDGYEFTHTDTRLWRRTRSVNLTVSTDCVGVDGNRNFDVAFNTLGVSSNPCSDVFPGPFAFSEPETGYVRDILLQYVNRIQLYNNIHSHGNYILYGFGNNTLPSNVAHIHHVGASWGAIMDAMKLPSANFYLVGNSGLVLYSTSGSAQDYGQYVGVPFSYTLELPGYGYDFRVPPTYMDHMVEETWRGIAVTARLSVIYYRLRYNLAYSHCRRLVQLDSTCAFFYCLQFFACLFWAIQDVSIVRSDGYVWDFYGVIVHAVSDRPAGGGGQARPPASGRHTQEFQAGRRAAAARQRPRSRRAQVRGACASSHIHRVVKALQ